MKNTEHNCRYSILKPNQSILKAYLREPVAESEITDFREAMKNLLQQIKPSETEEFNKNLVIEFFNQSLYKGNQYMVNTYHKADLAIYTKTDKPVVLFEFKGPSRPDMVTTDNLKHKSLYELILYYIREEVGKQNKDIKHLIITNCYEYFIFEKKDFYQWFASNKRFVQSVLAADTGDDKNDYIYKEIIKPEVERIEHKLRFTYLNIQDFARTISNDDIISKQKFVATYKLFSPTHLLKLPFKSDHNTLNTNFYQELLYIMGVEEVIEDNVNKIKRLKDNRQAYSLVEQAYTKIETLYYSKITEETSRFETALGLVLTWINRILFLKLLESQLESFGNSENIRFLNKQHIQDYDALNDLFFEVLAKPVSTRSAEMASQFPQVPYLNSSLFEPTQFEQEFFFISGIRLGEMEVFGKTVLKDGQGKKILGKKNAVEYLFDFLDAYDFGSKHNTNSEPVRQDSKTLINASVLGLIFEKINGYKDGSIFTPGYITQYICQETLRKAVVDKFNAVKGWECADFEELKERIDYGKREIRTDANEIVNSLKICDPAVGSGHFLVSALNELIAIKSELGILQDKQELPQRIRDYEVRVELDELVIFNQDDNYFKYDPTSIASQHIQEALFEEKRTIIENCLFGVDLNPKSVEICRLRLWIELLKSAYYYKDEETGKLQLQTLPNIDINIKSGDSLLHRFELNQSLSQILRTAKITIKEYRQAVAEYKNAHSKEEKRHLAEVIDKIKATLKTEISQRDPKLKELHEFQKELSLLQAKDIFDAELTPKQLAARRKKEQKLIENIKKIEDLFAEITSNKMYLGAFEWRIEFPEVLDDEGNFIGFDCIIGNPPFIQLQSNGGRLANLYENCKYTTFARKGDIYCLFYERGWQLLKPNGYLCFITSNTWMRAEYGEKTRLFFATKTNPELLIDFAGIKIFDSATVESNILRFSKSENTHETICVVANKEHKDCITNLDDLVQRQHTICDFSTFDSWVILSPIEQSIKRKIEAVGKPLKDWDINIYRGILTGYNDAFIISTEKRNEILSNCQSEDERTRTEELIRPVLRGRDIKRYGYDWADLWLINTHNGIKGKIPYIKIEDYPAVKVHLDQYWDKLCKRDDKGVTPYNLRNCAYLEDFSKQQIVWIELSDTPKFALVENITSLNTVFFMTGKHLLHILGLLNSKLITWYFRHCIGTTSGVGTNRWLKYTIEQIPLVLPNLELENMTTDICKLYDEPTNLQIDSLVCHLYDLNTTEMEYILQYS